MSEPNVNVQIVTKQQLVDEFNNLALQKVSIDEKLRDLRSAIAGYEMAEACLKTQKSD